MNSDSMANRDKPGNSVACGNGTLAKVHRQRTENEHVHHNSAVSRILQDSGWV